MHFITVLKENEQNNWNQYYRLKLSLIILMLNPFFLIIHFVLLLEILQLKLQFLLKQNCPRTILLSQNTAYHPLHESITQKDFAKFTQQGISFDEGATYPNYLPL